MKQIDATSVCVGKYEFKGFSYVNIPFEADYAIVKKQDEDCFRILQSNGTLSDPILELVQIGVSGLTLVKDGDAERPYRFIDSVGMFSDRYADVSITETTVSVENGEIVRVDKCGQKVIDNIIGKKTKVKKSKDSNWTPLKDEMMSMPFHGIKGEPLYFFCTKEYVREFMLHNLNGRYFLNDNFRVSIREKWKKELKQLLAKREAYYYSANRKEQCEIERSDEFYLQSDLDEWMQNIDFFISVRMEEAKAKIKKSLDKNVEKFESVLTN